MCPKPFPWAKNKTTLFPDGKSRGPLQAKAALKQLKHYFLSVLSNGGQCTRLKRKILKKVKALKYVSTTNYKQSMKLNYQSRTGRQISCLISLVEQCQSRYSTCLAQFKCNRNHLYQFTQTFTIIFINDKIKLFDNENVTYSLI